MNVESALVDHETAIVFRASAKKRIAAIDEQMQMSLPAGSLSGSACPASYLRELLAIQQQAVNLSLSRLQSLKQHFMDKQAASTD